MTAVAPRAPIPLNIVTGFLGAGKTTLLNRLLSDPALRDTMVLINEFGEIGLDHLLIEAVDGDMVLLSSGCLCCTIRGDLIDMLADLVKRRDAGTIAPFRRIIIETTGLADPAPVLHTIMFHPLLMLRYRLDGVITLIDAVNGATTLDAHEEAVKQAAVADRLVLTKTDLAPETAALRARLARLNPAARILDVREADAAALLDAGLYNPNTKSPDVARWLNAESVEAHHHDHDHHHHEQDVNRHDARIQAHCLRSATPIAPGGFDMFLELLRAAHGPNLLRVKGIVALSDDPSRPVVLHGVQHVFHPPVRLDAWPDGDHTTRMVFILRDLQAEFVERLWTAFTGAPRIGAPESEALQHNAP
ncbi:CobW family GTP-binding protein [Methylovirgula sp. 4M-Z18]|uniref:CobW family GTP-binding protein n=1 Tax=Methylovirgula sp. 4M-Z18 TaxID=2293567 RepID=UPI000E2FD7DF|nr:GTP-binding protein [Methylovirgula sp. 4M-Z18]RFB75013.1 GTP-binding protein [Methylovirgula sp. 4M-Z18]